MIAMPLGLLADERARPLLLSLISPTKKQVAFIRNFLYSYRQESEAVTVLSDNEKFYLQFHQSQGD
jgi:hypothetical protein